MRNIINLLYRYHAVLMFIVLEVVAFTLIITYNSYQRTSYFNSSNIAIGWFKDVTHSISAPFSAQSENKKLREENARLRELQLKNFYYGENHKVIINDTLYQQQYVYLPCEIIDNSYQRKKNYIVINAGIQKGVQKEMGIIGPDGIIGFVKDVSAHYAVVIPVLNDNFSTSVRLLKSYHFGPITWNGDDPSVVQLNDVQNTVPIEVGDTVVTKATSGRFPEGIVVGTILSVEKIPGKSHYAIDVKLATDFSNLHHAYVITNYFKKEYDELTGPYTDIE